MWMKYLDVEKLALAHGANPNFIDAPEERYNPPIEDPAIVAAAKRGFAPIVQACYSKKTLIEARS
jgi:hypothetical protein